MITGFNFSKEKKTVWIDPQDDPRKIFYDEGFIELSENQGLLEDFYKEGEDIKIKTSAGVFNLDIGEMCLKT